MTITVGTTPTMKKYQYIASWDDQTLTRIEEPVVALGDANVSQVEVTMPSNFLLNPTEAVARMYFLLPGEKESDFETLETATQDENGDYHVTWTIKHAHTQKGGRLAFSLTLIGDDAQWDSRTAIIPVYESRYQPESEESEEPYTGRLTALEGSMASIRGEFDEVREDFEEVKETATLGTPIPESLVANMQAGHAYIYTGTEPGYTAGHVYYYVNGTLTDGGVYGGTAVDATLTQSGQAADAKVTGDEIAEIKEDLSALSLSVEMGIFGYYSYLGNAITLQFNDGTVMMIDSFSVNAWSDVKSDLTARGITHLDYFMLTHWHGDHTGNIVNLITDGYIDANTTIYLPQDLDVDATGSLPSDWTAVVNNFKKVLPRITALGGTIIYPTEGQEVSIGGCKLRFWNTDHSVFYPGGAYASTNYNDWSLCAYLFVGNTNVCFTADIGPIGQQKMVDLNTMVKANLYTATHHGWDNGNASNYFGLLPDWINRLNPDIVFSEDYSIHDTYILRPSSPMQSWCEKNCVPNYRTAINGTMTVYVTSNGWSFGGAYSKYIREYNWGFDYHKKRLLARIDALKDSLLKERYVATTATYSFDRLLGDAVTALRGADYLNGYKYSFYIRVVDSDNADAYLEIIASNFQYMVTGAVITTRYSNVIRYNTGNPLGTITILGRTGNLTAIVEMLSYEEITE